MERIGMKDIFEASVEVKRVMEDFVNVRTVWDFECFDKDGNLKWAEYDRPNIVTNEGLNAMLNIMFHGAGQIDPWYVIPIESDTAAADTMTYAVPVFTECEAYTEATRQAFNEAAASGQSITNSANKATFTINATKTLYGGALVGGGTDDDTKGDAAGGGTLFAYSKFTSSKPVESGDTFKITCTVTAAHA
jgi:hypothetical protein